MATDPPPSPSRPLVNSTEVSSPGPYNNNYTAVTTNNTPRLSESSPYHVRRNSVGSNQQTTNTLNHVRRTSNSPPPTANLSAMPTYHRPRTPVNAQSDISSIRAPATTATMTNPTTPSAPPPPPLPVTPTEATASVVEVPEEKVTTTTMASAVKSPAVTVPAVTIPPPAATPAAVAPPPPPPASSAASANGYRPLNVKDALTYLDQVKVKFADQPEVYNRFLDIMKEFKSQAIDTPGVIERVSTLFRGHPMLIFGFNTFLPPGYRIECSTDDHARDIIKVTTPSGTTSTTSGEPLNLQSETTNNHVIESSRYYNHPQHPPSYNNFRSNNGPLPPISSYHAPPPPPPSSAPPLSSSTTASASMQNSVPPLTRPSQGGRSHSPPLPPPSQTAAGENNNGGTRRAPVEFNHAINYVNKIKNRFSNDPETYKQFLEILQTYQKEQKPIQEVYAQVQILFNGANDLLAEFKQFLPDTSQPQPIDFLSQQKAKLLKKRSLSGLPKQPKRPKTHHKMMDHTVSDIRRSPIIAPNDDIRPLVSADEAEFFERVKKYIGNKTTYHAFLRLLNLFSQQIFDANMLIEKCESFLGGQKDLYDQLKKLVGYDGKDIVIENLPAALVKPDLAFCDEYGPSYRSVPKAWQSQSCSGRDALCWEVLNDAYASHPTWASEDGGFVASKKNIFEEALHRVEEERYDYDLNIEANLNTISLLEPIAKKISLMSEEEKNAFKLPPGLGGPSKTIYQRIIKKIYGKEQGAGVIEMLHTNPAQSVPVVLKRLKQKDEEWKRSQREWNKVWREVEIKNYYKALDYQGVIFKANDRKTMSVKYLVTEIKSIHLDQDKRPNHLANIEPQFAFEFKNKKIFKDVTRVLYSYFERQTMYGIEDCEVMKAFIEMFLPVFFDVPDVLPEISLDQQSTDMNIDEDEDMVDEDEVMDEDDDDEDDDTQNSYDSSTDTSRSTRRGGNNYTRSTNGRRSPRHKPNDDDHQRLLKDVLTKTMKPSALEKMTEVKKEVIPLEIEEEDEEPSKDHKIYNLFGNTTFYCFFRLFQKCYERLNKMKQLDREYRMDPEKTKLMNKAALELNITTATFNSIEMDFKYGYYNALLKLIDRFFDDELDQHVFEECARYIFGTKAYIMFTIDKLMLSIMRQLHQIVTEPKAQELLSFFKKNHEHEKGSPELTQAYRLEVAEALGADDNLYNLAFDTCSRTLSIQLLGKDDETFELNDSDGYTNYVANYVDWEHETPGVDRKAMEKQFLKRNLMQCNSEDKDAVNRPDLQYKICANTYHMFYVIGTEDVFYRTTKQDATTDVSRKDAFKLWLDKGKDQSELENKARALYSLQK